VIPAERHTRNLARLAELELQLADATTTPWCRPLDDPFILVTCPDDHEIVSAASRVDVALICNTVNSLPAVLALIRGVIERHAPQQHAPGHDSYYWCPAEGDYFPCADYLAAENVLGVGDE
jgi:hypothetical protein